VDFKIVGYEPGDEEFFAMIHKESLQVGLLSTLCVPTLREYYYRLASQENIKIFVVRSEADEPIGFCVIQIGKDSFKSFLSIRIVSGLLFSVLRKPRFFKVIVNQNILIKNYVVGEADVLIFCVNKFSRGIGIGNCLISAAVSWCKRNNISSLYTTTHNERLTNFYIKNYGAYLVSQIDFGFYRASKVKIF
jgi:ribosomal protein S18 acetylase RimI-like enzyme